MQIFLTEGQSALAHGLLDAIAELRSVQCTLYQGAADDSAALEKALVASAPDFVINTLQFDDLGQVDAAPDRAWQLNAILPDHLAHICLDLGIGLVQVSSDEVIGESRNGPFSERDTVHPVNTFGETKWQGEEAVRQLLKRHIILRLGSLFDYRLQDVSGVAKGWLEWILDECQHPQGLQDAADITVSPTAVSDASRVILAMIHQLDAGADCWGTYHYAGVEPVSRAQFAEQVIELAQDRGLLTGIEEVRGVSAVALGLAGRQALHREMNCQKIMNHFGIKQRSWRPALVDALERIADQREALAAEQQEHL